ncbi:MAG: hypothetical protein KBB11_02165 [Bacteroidales bacterium]|nr:hypothetical protein [Bacteroidales bacterium]HOY39557.1 hypothetical protein [Bacteroidales bacterium]HQP04003.1 hypothetical protein [Bacteroidales bacterium]
MSKILLTFVSFIIVWSVSFSQTLTSFVEEKQANMVYDTAKLLQVPNTSVKMIPPEYFIPDENIHGFAHPGSACTIQVIEIPGVSHQTIESAMTDEYISSQGYKLIEKKVVQTKTGERAAWFVVQFNTKDVVYERIMLFTGSSNTIWVNANYPQELKKLLLPALEAALLSVQ